jgi:glucose-1-phosphate thymidylyltransferase
MLAKRGYFHDMGSPISCSFIWNVRTKFTMQLLCRGMLWLDVGTPDALLIASHLVQTVETRQGVKIASLEEIAWREGYVDEPSFRKLASAGFRLSYSDYLRRLSGIEES